MSNKKSFEEQTGLNLDEIINKFENLIQTHTGPDNAGEFVDVVSSALTPREMAGVMYILTVTHPD